MDLFVRESNDLAIGLYENLGYIVFRRVKDYYGGGPKGRDEDGFGQSLSRSLFAAREADSQERVGMIDMRKPLPRDRHKVSVRLPQGVKDGREVVCRPEDVVF